MLTRGSLRSARGLEVLARRAEAVAIATELGERRQRLVQRQHLLIVRPSHSHLVERDVHRAPAALVG